MNRLWLAALFTSALIIACAAGYWLGVREGLSLDNLYVTPWRGALATRALTDMKEGKTGGASIVLEFQVDRGLLALSQLDESPFDQFLATIPGFDIHHIPKDELARLANYRKANPSSFQSEEWFIHDPEETPEHRAWVDETLEQHRKAVRDIQRVVEQYASK